MRRLLVLALLGCASSGGRGGSTTTTTPAPDRILLVDERGQIYRSTNNTIDVAEQIVPGTRDVAVQQLVGAYEELGISVTSMETAAGRVASQNFTPALRLGGQPMTTYVNCGADQFGRPRAGTYALLLNTSSSVDEPSPGQVRVRTVMRATGRQRGVSSEPINCESTGLLERRLHTMFATRMAK
jgi:hypothetical protein